MRDIRQDLRERLDGLRQEQDRLQTQLQAKLKEIADYQDHLNRLLEMEERRSIEMQAVELSNQPRLDFQPRIGGMSGSGSTKDEMESAIMVMLQDGLAVPHAALKERLEQAGFGRGQRLFGRVLHGTLLSMRSRELVDLVGKGTWRLRSRGNGAMRSGSVRATDELFEAS